MAGRVEVVIEAGQLLCHDPEAESVDNGGVCFEVLVDGERSLGSSSAVGAFCWVELNAM